MSVCLFVWLSGCLSFHPSVRLSVCLVVWSVCLPACLSACLPGCLSVCLSFCKLENEAILRDCLKFRTSQRQNASIRQDVLKSRIRRHQKNAAIRKRKNSARLLDFRNYQHQKRSNSAIGFLQNGLLTLRCAICPCYLSTVLRMPQKSYARSYKVRHLSRNMIWANLTIWCS